MKRKSVVALLTVAILSMSGCSLNGINSAPAMTGEIVDIVESTDDSSKQSQENVDSTGQVADSVTDSEYLDVEFEYVEDSCYEEVSLMYGHYNTVKLNTEGYPELKSAVDAYSSERAKEAQAYLDELEQWAREEYTEYGADMFMGPFVAESDMYLRRGDSRVLSIVEACYSYEGGAHGNSFYDGVNFDAQTGEEISLETVVTDMESLPGILATEIREKYPDLNFWTEDLTGLMQSYITPSEEEYKPVFTWTLDYEGVTFYFSDYELGSYADGRQEVTVSYSEYPQILNSKYFEDIEGNYVVQLFNNWVGSDMDINRDGVTDYVSVRGNYNAEAEMYESIDVTVNGNTFTQNVYFYDSQTYLVKANGHTYLYVQHRAESDFESVSVFEITECSVEYMGNFTNSVSNFTNSLKFTVSRRIDLLSTYYGTIQCCVGEDGMPVEIEDFYSLNPELTLTSTAPITADLVAEDGLLEGSTYEFPAGTVFRLMTTDGETYVDVLADDGQRCRFYTTSEWPPTVNELDATSCFEMLYYAG